MKSDNEIIAEFMGCTRNGDFWLIPGKRQGRTSSELLYHKSFDWLMPVVEKIETMRCTKIGIDNQIQFNDVLNIPISAPMHNIYLCVANFIKWYNDSVLIEREKDMKT